MITKRITKSEYLELEEKYNKLQEEYNELKFKLEYYETDCNKLSRENLELQGKNDLLCKTLEVKLETIRDLFVQVQELTKENKQLKSNALPRKHNERNAGRKAKFDKDIINYVVDLRGYGWDYAFIKDKVFSKYGKNISLATISNIIKKTGKK